MKGKFVIAGGLLVITVALWFVKEELTSLYFDKAFYTSLAILIIYITIKILMELLISDRIKEGKTRYSLKKTASILSILAFIAAAIAIWIDNILTLLVSYGILAAGAAVALQDVFKNFAGSLIIFITRTYHVGDRIEMNSKIGDVIDIGIFYTTLLETNEWVGGDQATGRLSIIPNSSVISGVVNNYTKDHPYIWDEISIPITYDSDWKTALEMLKSVIATETRASAEKSEASVSNLSAKYYLPEKATESTVYAVLTDNWITMNIRYITEVRRRRELKDRLNRIILTELEQVDNIKIASESMDINIKELPGNKLV